MAKSKKSTKKVEEKELKKEEINEEIVAETSEKDVEKSEKVAEKAEKAVEESDEVVEKKKEEVKKNLGNDKTEASLLVSEPEVKKEDCDCDKSEKKQEDITNKESLNKQFNTPEEFFEYVVTTLSRIERALEEEGEPAEMAEEEVVFNFDSDEFKTAVADRVKLEKEASTLLKEDLSNKTEREIYTEVVGKTFNIEVTEEHTDDVLKGLYLAALQANDDGSEAFKSIMEGHATKETVKKDYATRHKEKKIERCNKKK